jgi:hypothetical protein
VHAVLEGFLIATGLMLASLALAVLWVRHRVRRRLRIAPRVRSAAPTTFVVSAGPAARFHRRLRRVSMEAQLAGRLDPALTGLADELIAEALALEPAVLAVARGGRSRSVGRREIGAQIGELEGVGRRLSTLAAQASRATGDGGANRVRERLVAIEAARVELAEIDLHAGLIRHA